MRRRLLVGMLERQHFSMEGKQKGYFFGQKLYIKARGWIRGGASSYKTMLSSPPPPWVSDKDIILVSCSPFVVALCIQSSSFYTGSLFRNKIAITMGRKAFLKSDMCTTQSDEKRNKNTIDEYIALASTILLSTWIVTKLNTEIISLKSSLAATLYIEMLHYLALCFNMTVWLYNFHAFCRVHRYKTLPKQLCQFLI